MINKSQEFKFPISKKFMFTYSFYRAGYELHLVIHTRIGRFGDMNFYRLITKLTFLQPRNVRGVQHRYDGAGLFVRHWQSDISSSLVFGDREKSPLC